MTDDEQRERPQLAHDPTAFVRGLVALGKSVDDAHGKDIRALGEWLTDMNRRLSAWVEQNRPALEHFGQAVSTVLAKLPEWKANLEANMLLVQRGLDVMRAEGYGGAGYILSMHETIELGAVPLEEIERRLYSESVKSEFSQAMLDLYKSSGLRPDRSPLIEEAMGLHRDGRFGGAVTLVYSQFEGIVTDALVELGYASPATKYSVSSNDRELLGLHPKLKIADAQLANATEIFSALLQGVLTSSDRDSTVSKTRNHVLHGGDTGFATRQRSTQMVLWTLAILIELRSVLPVRAVPQMQAAMLSDLPLR